MDVLGPHRCALPREDMSAKIYNGHLGEIGKGLGYPASPLRAPTPTQRAGRGHRGAYTVKASPPGEV